MTIERAAQDTKSVSIDILSDFPSCYSQYHDPYRIEEEEEKEEEEVGESIAGIIVIVLWREGEAARKYGLFMYMYGNREERSTKE